MDDYAATARRRFFGDSYGREYYDKYWRDKTSRSEKFEAVLDALIAADSACEPNGVGAEHVYAFLDLIASEPIP